MPQFLVVGAGAALGAVARYLLSAALGGGMIPLLPVSYTHLTLPTSYYV